MCNAVIAVVAHKPYPMPQSDIYLPLHAGGALRPDVLPDFAQDDSGDNISLRNGTYCELTGLYWLWKNADAPYLGLVHYRRYLGSFAPPHAMPDRKNRFARIMTHRDLNETMALTDIIVPTKRHYVIECVRSHYEHTHSGVQLDVTRQVIAERCPEFLPSFDQVMASRSAHMFNMFVMTRAKLDEYCSWLFPIVDAVAARVDTTGYSDFDARFPGRISEMLLDVWLDGTGYDYAEMPLASTEPVRWDRKIVAFLKAKFLGCKYSGSF